MYTSVGNPKRKGIQTSITILKVFASQFSSLQITNTHLQKEAASSSSKLDRAITIGAKDRREVDVLKKELDILKKRIKEEEKTKAKAQAQQKEKENLLLKSIIALLGAANISSVSTSKLPAEPSVDVVSLAIESSDHIQALLQKNKTVLAKLHAMILPKADQQKSLEQLVDTFFTNTEGTIEVVPVPSFVGSSSTNDSESDRLQQMKTRITQMERDMRNIHAMVAIIMEKGEMAVDAERKQFFSFPF
ncbi:hypothetical protein QYE76_028171 [Lolium multiflorum]|uniref:Uncharacterized protein n=1 Tax=Lolium multiflorum TaxID=4521 RepID=A0AAD8QP00_LOLMU|nr:hypothetical protein QYE76_028171 [Lolium multiflorum]